MPCNIPKKCHYKTSLSLHTISFRCRQGLKRLLEIQIVSIYDVLRSPKLPPRCQSLDIHKNGHFYIAVSTNCLLFAGFPLN